MDSVPRLGSTAHPGETVRIDRLARGAWLGTLALLPLIALVAALLFGMGREPWCTCGYVKLWHGVVQSAGNSQHLTDWYTFAHLLDGFVFYLLLWLVGSRWPVALRLMLATVLAGAWEILENTDFVIDHFRSATLALGYRGDSIVNSISDVVACILGFAVAAFLPVRLSLALAAPIAIVAAWVAGAHSSLLPTLLAPFGALMK